MAMTSWNPLQREIIVEVFIYCLGVITNVSPLFLLVFILLALLIHLLIIPVVWPPTMIRAAEARIKETETLLHDEDARRFENTVMANISLRGRASLDAFRVVVEDLSKRDHQNLFHLSQIHQYLRDVCKISRDSRRCLRDVKKLRVDLKQQIRALDHPTVATQVEENPEAATLLYASDPTNSVDTIV